ncbi:YjbH domain-containing protein [Citreicella sp. C3M06]|uniref:YjbH domain-containing protein n=1 Tax=Citreicella sp. C3M06 TaxID=2841564 RepID=UPI001C094797|nr:YjbH domain-containing protein [Citreicella sp. C3M06]MBU2962047.1 YjbH domain-containing protein [Citreicella sp. C3M06]
MPVLNRAGRGRVAARACVLAATTCALSAGAALPQESPWIWNRPVLNFMGVPGIIDMPTAHSARDADIDVSLSILDGSRRLTGHFQITPRLSGVFRYANLDSYQGIDPYYDRSFDLRFLLHEETARMPAVTVGLQDFGGTGIYAGEYLVATKTFGRLRATTGLGWGRFAGRDGFDNPLGLFSDEFKTRPSGPSGVQGTGQLDAKQWFRGDAALFAGLQYAVNDRLTLSAEYSTDTYSNEEQYTSFEYRSPVNVGLSYRYSNSLSISGAWLHGSAVAAGLTYTFNPKTPNRYPGGFDRAPFPVTPRPPGSAADLGWTQLADADGILRDNMQRYLAIDDLLLEGFDVGPRSARISLRMGRQTAPAQVIGRVARMMTNNLPPSVERYDITLIDNNGLAVSTVTLTRSDLEELEHAPDGAWQSFARAKIVSAQDLPTVVDAAYPKASWRLGPYLEASYFDPESPIRLTFGAELSGRYEPAPGLVLQGALRQKLAGNAGDLPTSNSVLEHVRSDNARYADQDGITMPSLTAAKFFRPGEDVFGRITAGWFEPMFGGLSGEVLWKPVDSRLGLGLEINYAKQREYEQGFGFQSYDVWTGHASAYWQGDGGFAYQLDAGRYLAGDWGATLGIDRTFGNGISIGAFATLTDVSFDDFGEGSFDKGIRFDIPLSALTGQRTRASISRTIRPVQRDGGARLEVDGRLYEQVRDFQQPALQSDWGRFWR